MKPLRLALFASALAIVAFEVHDSNLVPWAAQKIVAEQPKDTEPRKVYRYSIVSGGVYSPAEFRSVQSDPVVREHYAGLTVTAVGHLSKPEGFYASYRLNNRIFWTSRKILVSATEFVLATNNGLVRARCGNRLSRVAMKPTAAPEPSAVVMDQFSTPPLIGAPVPAFAPILLASRGIPVLPAEMESALTQPDVPAPKPPFDLADSPSGGGFTGFTGGGFAGPRKVKPLPSKPVPGIPVVIPPIVRPPVPVIVPPIVSNTPEPGTWALVGLAVVVIGVWRKGK